jgi:hypothetical protein
MSKSSKHMPNYLKRTETSVVLIVFNDVLYLVRAYKFVPFELKLSGNDFVTCNGSI